MRGLRERAVGYAGVDCNTVLPSLRARVDGEGELLGRRWMCDTLLDTLGDETFVEIIGERHMGLSRILSWFASMGTS